MCKKTDLSELIPKYVEELNSVDVSQYEDYQFSEKYLNRKKQLIKRRKKIYYPMIKTTGRRIAAAIIAAVMMGSITTVAYAPARHTVSNFFMKDSHKGYEDIDIKITDKEHDTHKKTIEREYNITVPEGFAFRDKDDYIRTDEFISKVYSTEDNQNYVSFDQYVAEKYDGRTDYEDAKTVKKIDKFGNEILVYNYKDMYVSITWDDGEYIFKLVSGLPERELMEVYYSLH